MAVRAIVECGAVEVVRGGDREGMQERFREREQRIQQFTIVHEDPTFRFKYGDGGENVFYTDGRMTEDPGGRPSGSQGELEEGQAHRDRARLATRRCDHREVRTFRRRQSALRQDQDRGQRANAQDQFPRGSTTASPTSSRNLSPKDLVNDSLSPTEIKVSLFVGTTLCRWPSLGPQPGLWTESLQFYQRSTQARHRS